MTRQQGIQRVRQLDHVKPRRDLERWLDYVGVKEEELDAIADTFRNPRVWRIENGRWVKDNIWGEPAEYGPVRLADPDKLRAFRNSESVESCPPA